MWDEIINAGVPFFLLGLVFGWMLCEIKRAIDLKNEDDMETLRSKHDPNDPYSCTCGNRHPLVENFGKCGRCMDKIHGSEL